MALAKVEGIVRPTQKEGTVMASPNAINLLGGEILTTLRVYEKNQVQLAR